MSEYAITVDDQQENGLVSMPILGSSKNRDGLHVILPGGHRSVFFRLSQRQVIVILLLCGGGFLILYAFWDMMLFLKLSTDEGLSYRPSNKPLADSLEQQVRVLCWVMTTPKHHKTRAVHIQRTWAKRCNKIYFVTSGEDDELHTLVVNKTDKYELLWGKVKAAFIHIYENDLNEADWFMKADDDTYVFVENLRHMLYPYDPEQAIHFGYNFKQFGNPNASYMSGGSGYILSREAVRQFVHGLSDSTKCRPEDDSAEDVEIGVCLHKLGVPAGDTRDDKLRNRFFPLAPFSALISHYDGMDFWLFKYAYYNPRACMNCLSDYPVAFHYVDPKELYFYDYFNYKFQLFGRLPLQEHLPEKIPADQLYIPPSNNIY